MLRKHQLELQQIVRDIALDIEPARNVLVSVTPGGGKSALPAILAAEIAEQRGWKICWVVPRHALRTQGEADFIEPWLQDMAGHKCEIRASINDLNPSRNTIGYVTTYQAIVANPQLHQQEFRLHGPYILFLDECHHVPVPGSEGEEAAFYSAIAPLVELAKLRIFATGTLERHDGQAIAFLPYTDTLGKFVDLKTRGEGWRVVRYTRGDALKEGAIVPLHMYYGDGNAAWIDSKGNEMSVESIAEMDRTSQAAALQTVLETEYAFTLIDNALDDWRKYKKAKYHPAQVLVIAPGINVAKKYLKYLKEKSLSVGIATTDDTEEAYRNIEYFKDGRLEALVTVGMAYEGLNNKRISHVILLTKIRSKPWIEQAISRGNRSDSDKTHGYIFAPDDPAMRKVLDAIEKEQQGMVFDPKSKTWPPPPPPPERDVIAPLGSELTRARAHGLEDGSEVTYNDYERFRQAMDETGMVGSTVQLWQTLTLLGLVGIENGGGDKKLHPVMVQPVSKREAQLRDTIRRYIGSIARGDPDKHQEIRRAALFIHGPIGELTYDQLREEFAWLQRTYPGGVAYEDRQQTT